MGGKAITLFPDIGSKLSCHLIQLIFVWCCSERICDLVIRASGLKCQPCQPGGPGQVTSNLLFYSRDALPPAHVTGCQDRSRWSVLVLGPQTARWCQKLLRDTGCHFGMSPKGRTDDPGVLRRVCHCQHQERLVQMGTVEWQRNRLGKAF